MSWANRQLHLEKWPLLTNKKNSCAECTLYQNMTIKIKPLYNITSSIKITLNFMSKVYLTLWKDMLTEKNNLNTKKLNASSNKNKIFLSPPKKVPKYFLTLKTKTKNQTTVMFSMILLKAMSFLTNKITNPKYSSICAKKLIRHFKLNHYHQ